MAVRTFRSVLLLFAGLTMILSSIGGCTARGQEVQTGSDGRLREVSYPSADFLDRIPEDTPVRLHLLSGNIVEGFFLSCNRESTSIMFRMQQTDAALSSEFNPEGRIYHVPLEKIVTLQVLEDPDSSKVTGLIVGVALIVVGAVLIWANAMSRAMGN